MPIRSRPALFLAPVLAVGLLASACGGGTATGSSATTAPTPKGSVDPSLHDALPAAIKESGVIRFAGDSHPPWRIVGPDGKTVTGIDPELQAALGAVLGVRVEISIVDNLPAALAGMKSGRYDAFNGPVRDTVEREKEFDAISYLVTRTAYLVPKDGGGAKIGSSADLCGRKVAGVGGSVTEDQVKKLTAWCTKGGKPGVEFIGLTDTNAIILAAKSGRADAAGMTESDAGIHVKETGAFTYVAQTEEQGAGIDHLALLVPKTGGLGPAMLAAFKALFANGDYKRLMEAHGLEKVTVPEPKLNIETTG